MRQYHWYQQETVGPPPLTALGVAQQQMLCLGKRAEPQCQQLFLLLRIRHLSASLRNNSGNGGTPIASP
jgi:hypothetical protein